MDEQRLPHDHGNHVKEEKIRRHLPAEAEITGVADAMKQLGDPSRLRIFWLLCHCEECVLNIAAIVNMSSPAVSHHLRILKSSGLIVSRREGKEMYYKTADTELAQMLHHMIEKLGKITCPSGE
ncbi:MAG TPA: metalloregulator ArsR/SmtB family transcription factor [Candidatus Mediterraneibacter merdipullorum]|nr:metalloregulator ArsR/SmtB family transcription factor [Candidatus Mediterraneibacter merdipullorum]